MYKNFLVEMVKNDITTHTLAEKLNISLPSLKKKLSGQNDFKISEIQSIISLFGNSISFEYLFKE